MTETIYHIQDFLRTFENIQLVAAPTGTCASRGDRLVLGISTLSSADLTNRQTFRSQTW